MNNEHIPEYDRIIAYEKDIADTRANPRLAESEAPKEVSADLVDEVEYFLDHCDVTSNEQLVGLHERLDVAIAISNDPKAREILLSLKKRFHTEAF